MPTRPTYPNAGIAARYEHTLTTHIAAMAHDCERRLLTLYAPAAAIATDASPMSALRTAMRQLAKRWTRNFDKLAPELAAWFARQAQENVDTQMRADASTNDGLRALFRKRGWTVRMTMTPALRDVAQATVAESVALIRSLPDQYLKSVEGLAMRSVSTGRDLATLAQGLEKQHGVTKRRAARIALQTNNSATAAITRARQLALGLEKAEWLHSAGGKVPRPEHVAHSGKPYDIRNGIVLVPDEGLVWPGTAINCRCVSGGALIPGLDY